METTLADYLDRIGVAPGPADAELLARIVGAHIAAIAFENLDPFTGTEPPVTGDAIAAKLVHGGRGGWCFEHNALLHDMLRELGYPVTPLLGRVRMGIAEDAPPTQRTHRVTLVETGDGPVIADVGFGGPVPTAPLRLVDGSVQPTTFADYRYLRREPDRWRLQRRGSGDWITQYDIELTPVPDVDYAMGSWYLVHHPDSHFRAGLNAARSFADRRITLSGTRYTVRHTDGRAEERDLGSVPEVLAVLQEAFGIDTSGVTGLEQRIRDVHLS
ncbi:arylamine N-acetyltransferase family protein [Pseudonocardia sp. HH130630-07]|uniref:arylamine N-acetyltransferase family protein n=1 Tax=Pseudonocardia sp. HH130630-07 TaxID=1690815 RepID=UPI0008152B10|nr:arylamine N-acetyltransferase [Pseudonocardia sp. HH130630-07]ANY09002.1 hypothetical protein AFB00_25105 [Pseudonocardia sp. HH130630-07]